MTPNPAPSWGRDAGLLHIGAPPGPLTAQAVADRLLIIETMHRYGWAYDERDADALRDCFTEDTVFEASIANGTPIGPYRGRKDFLDWLTAFWTQQRDQRRHVVLNPIINDLRSDSAVALSYLLLTSAQDGAMTATTTGFYRMCMSKRAGRWQIEHFYAGFDTPF
jgi:ketosteroid isomerase-like protein